MSEHTVRIEDLKKVSDEHEKDIATFLKEQLPSGTEVEAGPEMKIKSKVEVAPLTLRALLKKYLARKRLVDELRVVSLSGSLAVKARKRKRI